jgi:hypothetical protein
MRKFLIVIVFFFIGFAGHAQSTVNVNIDVSSLSKSISPYIFGKNNNLSDDKGRPLTAAQWQRLRDLGIQMFRENGGNNASKYNWRRKLSSHPDWYNNVYAHSWDFAAKSLQQNIPSVQGMWAFQLAGKAAKTSANNFGDWNYNGSQWWSGVAQNLAGGGVVNTAGGADALTEGNPNLYLEDWPADSTTGILNHWFGAGGIGLDPGKIRYWSMDNEPEIWEGTHDDIWPVQPDAETFMQMYFAVAKKARELYPDIKLIGPVPANEWQWYNYKTGKTLYKGKQYVWLEYFIFRVAEEQQATGIRLLDNLDIHFYPGETNAGDIVQLHRVFFDTTYVYPGANGVKRSGTGDWDGTIVKEYIFKRCNDWMTKYLGSDHGVKLSVSEMGINGENPNVTASWYASTLGEFAKQGVEIFTPWGWKTGMDEVIHLFSRYSLPYFINGISSQEQFVSAYPTTNYNRDSLTIFLVNRHLTEMQSVDLNLAEFPLNDGSYTRYTLSGLPSTETFVSHSVNAIETVSVNVVNNKLNLQLPALSVSAVVLKRAGTIHSNFGDLVAEAEAEGGILNGVTISNSAPGFSGTGYVTGFDNTGDKVTVKVSVPEKGFYSVFIRYLGAGGDKYQDFSVNNGFSSSVYFPASDTFTYSDAGSYILQKGVNTLSIIKNWGWTDIDKFEVYATAKRTFDIVPGLVDTAATDATKALYRYLSLQFGDRIISGQTRDSFIYLSKLIGKTPMLQASDLYRFSDGYPYKWVNGAHGFGKDPDNSVEELINWYNITTGKKGIVALHWHWCSPSGGAAGTNTFYTEFTTFDITRAVTPGTAEYDLIIRDIDDIAIQLKKFRDAGVPVLWRPLHEAGGGWFWWGAKGPEACKKLYNIMFERLKNYHQLHNLIWVWSTPETDWYPGNDKVDIIGHDSYPGAFNYGNQKNAFDRLYDLTNGEKLIAMTENGPIPDPDESLQFDAPWLLFMSWVDLTFTQNSNAHLIDIYNNSNVLTLESANSVINNEWRSTLYPEDWKPGFKDYQGRYLHDFSYAGYHQGEKEIPKVMNKVVDVTFPPYNADKTGVTDVTAIVQQALDEVGSSGGGVVYLPAGKYQIRTSAGSSSALRIQYDSTILRGAGPDSTFLFHDETNMRNKNIIQVMGDYGGWFSPDGTSTNITIDLLEPTRIIPVQSTTGFHAGDLVVLASTATEDFIAEHKMAGIWDAASIEGVAFLRHIDSVDINNNLIIVDAPIRYFLKTRDQARIYHAKKHIREVGIENFAIGNVQNPGSGWGEEDYSVPGTGAYDVHASHVIRFNYCENAWLKNVQSYKPSENTEDIHVLSNALLLDQCRNITVDSCFFQKPQYEGGGGNGYMYTLQSNDCLIKKSTANHGRHNFDFKYPYSNGNVVLQCRSENSKYASDFHMYLSMSNLFDGCTLNGDYLESTFRPYGNAIHGYSSTQSVFYNTIGEAYHPSKNYLIESKQFGWGYVIGTSGPANTVLVEPTQGITDGYYFNTAPTDFVEGVGTGNDLRPVSLYLDQLERRMKDAGKIMMYRLDIVVKDAETNAVIPGAKVQVYDEVVVTDLAGSARFENVFDVFVLSIENKFYTSLGKNQFSIYSDTTLTFYLSPKNFDVKFTLLDSKTLQKFRDVNVNFGPLTMVTDAEGQAAFTLGTGTYEYSINKPLFQVETGSKTISSDTSFVIYLIQTHANVKFRLYSGANPLNNVKIKINSDSLLTNLLGIALFKSLPLDNSYSYSTEKSGYFNQSGEFFLSMDTVINLIIEPFALKTESSINKDKIRIWPNPASDFLYCSFPATGLNRTVLITDMLGNEIYSENITEDELIISLNNYPSGVYTIRILSGKDHNRKLFIKN